MSLNTALLLDHISAPILVLRKNYTVKYCNNPAKDLIQDLDEGVCVTDYLKDEGLLKAVAEIFNGSSKQKVEFLLEGAVDHILQVSVTPFEQEAEPKYAVLILHDVTAMRRAEQMRADFVANASHELKTPLSSLMGFIETLLGPARGDQEALEKFLRIMRTQTDRMANLVKDLLSLSRIELDEHMLPEGAVDLVAVIRRVIDTLELKAEQRGISIKFDPEFDQAIIRADDEQIYQLFQNLVQNAVKYTRSHSAVEVQIKTENGVRGKKWYRVTVRDFGEGISRIHLPRLTERFYRVDTARSRDLGGTGLGLAIVKHILNRHRGKLLIESEVGQGSEFTALLREDCRDAKIEQSLWENS